MIEMKTISSLNDSKHFTNEMEEQTLIEAIAFAQEALKKANIAYETNFEKACKVKANVELVEFSIGKDVIGKEFHFSTSVKCCTGCKCRKRFFGSFCGFFFVAGKRFS